MTEVNAFSGVLGKMKVSQDSIVKYSLRLSDREVLDLNAQIGHRLEIFWTGNIYCVNCGKKIKKAYAQGFCFPCLSDAPQAAPCIIRPELCEAHLGGGKHKEWEEEHHNKPHYVYLAQTSGIKVGVTRTTQVPTRWIDQGAWRALIIAQAPYRQLAGLLELELKQYLSDRTDWRKMLINQLSEENIEEVRDDLLAFLPANLEQYAIPDAEVEEFKYPINVYPEGVNNLQLEKNTRISGILSGIRGQYLYLDGEGVINLRKYSGYEVEVKTE